MTFNDVDTTGLTKFVRNTKRWKVKNEILMGVLWVKDIKISEMAEEVGVSTRSVQRWIYEGQLPNEQNIEKIEIALGYPSCVIFYNFKKE